MQAFNYRSFKLAFVITITLGILLLLASLIIGRNNFFLLANHDLGKIADKIFVVLSFSGEWINWLFLLMYVAIVIKRLDTFPLLLSSFIISTFFVRLFKDLLLPNMPRPIKAFGSRDLFHSLSADTLHQVASFPSGHTTAACTVYLVLCLYLPQKWWLPIGLFYAGMVGYSRVYLAQHFPSDVAGGFIIAPISVWLALRIQEKISMKQLFPKKKV